MLALFLLQVSIPVHSTFWSFDAGQVTIVGTIIGACIFAVRKFDRFGMEHEMLIDWYCKTHDIRKEELVTRARGRYYNTWGRRDS